MRRPAVAAVLLAAAATAAAALATMPANAPLGFLEETALDTQFRLRGPLAPTTPIVLVDIDDEALGRMGGFPFDRAALAELIDRAAEAGATLIVPDILLPPSRVSRPEADAALALAIRDAGRVLLPFAFLYQDGTGQPVELPPQIEAAAIAVVRLDRLAHSAAAPHPTGVVLPDAPFLDAAGYGHVNVVRSEAGGVRYADIAVRFGDHYFPFLPAVIAARVSGAARSEVVLRAGETLDIGGRRVPLDGFDRMPVNHYGPPDTFRRVGASDVLAGDADPGLFRDRIVFISVSAPGVGDQFRSPFSVALPGTDLLATVTDNILGGRMLHRPAWSPPAAILAAFLLAALAARVILGARVVLGIGVAVVGAAAWLVTAQVLFAQHHALVSVPIPLLALVPAVGLAVAWTVTAAGRRRGRELSAVRDRAAFAPALSALAAELDEGGGPKTLICTVVFADLQGFTRRSQSASPEEVHALMGRTIATLAEAAERHGGVLVKSLGDGGMLLFGAPDAGPDAPARALGFIRETASADAGAGDDALDIRIGAHCGPVSFGLVAAGGRREVDVAGDTVNVASRLQTLTRKHGTAAIASDQLIEAAVAAAGEQGRAGFEKAPKVRLRGRDRSIGIWLWRGPAEDA